MERLSRFEVSGLNSYIDLAVDFNFDLTILYGLNGSGKTSALRLLVCLLEGDVKEIFLTPFSKATLSLRSKKNRVVEISASKTTRDLTLRFESGKKLIPWTISTDSFYDEDFLKTIQSNFEQSDTNKAIQGVESPVFLGVDRCYENLPEAGPRDRFLRDEASFYRHRTENRFRSARLSKHIKNDKGLLTALSLVESAIMEATRKEGRLNTEFRDRILMESFRSTSIDSIDFGDINLSIPDLNDLHQQETKVMEMLDKLDSDSQDLRKHARELFEGVRKLVERLEKRRIEARDDFEPAITLEVLVNKSKLAYLEVISNIAVDYSEKRASAYKKVNEYMSLVNRFFTLINKNVELGQNDTIQIKYRDKDIPYYYLSSGERQIVIVLAHLIFNSQLETSSIFIVDEPELSLHIAWQEMLLDAIIDANSDIQLLFATHSPSIIGNKPEYCVALENSI